MEGVDSSGQRLRLRGARIRARLARRGVPRRWPVAVVLAAGVAAAAGCGDGRTDGSSSETARPRGASETARARGASETDGAWSEALRREVLRMRDADQEVRSELVARMRGGPAKDSAEMRRLVARQDSVDRANTERLRGIIREHGWPGVERAGREAANAAFLLVQHATHDLGFQKEYLAFLEEEHRAGRAPGEAVALLTDRTRQAEGKLQLYGTQMSIRDGEVVMDPIQDEKGVDRRRAALGLVPLDEYIAQVKEAYGQPD